MASKEYIQRFRGNSYIDCPFAEKETAKEMGAKWDASRKRWYIPSGKNVQPFFKKWKSHCRLCNALLTCDSGKFENSCENTEAGVCCEYDWSGNYHCKYTSD